MILIDKIKIKQNKKDMKNLMLNIEHFQLEGDLETPMNDLFSSFQKDETIIIKSKFFFFLLNQIL